MMSLHHWKWWFMYRFDAKYFSWRFFLISWRNISKCCNTKIFTKWLSAWKWNVFDRIIPCLSHVLHFCGYLNQILIFWCLLLSLQKMLQHHTFVLFHIIVYYHQCFNLCLEDKEYFPQHWITFFLQDDIEGLFRDIEDHLLDSKTGYEDLSIRGLIHIVTDIQQDHSTNTKRIMERIDTHPENHKIRFYQEV